MNLSSEDLAAIEAIVVKVVSAAIQPAPVVYTSLPEREIQPGEVEALRAAFPGGADETCVSVLTFRAPAEAAAWLEGLLLAFGVSELNSLPHNVLQAVPLYASVPGPNPCRPPEPFPGSIEATNDPAEILQRARQGRDWAGNPPVGEAGLETRRAILSNLRSKSPGAAGADWYAASPEALEVLILGAGFNPYSALLQSGAPYPCPGVLDLAGVCAAITGGGSPGGYPG